MHNIKLVKTISLILLLPMLFSVSFAQKKKEREKKNNEVRTMTIPISIFSKEELETKKATEFIEAGQIIVKENKDPQEILSIRSVSNTPLALAVLIQDDLSSKVNSHLQDIKNFIKDLPDGSRVMVAYLRAGKLQVRQKFTTNLDKAADSIRIVVSNSAVAPRNPYDGVYDALKRFDSLPTGRRAILLLSDGLDVSNGVRSSTPGLSQDLDRAILSAQRKSVAIYSFYSSATYTENGSPQLILSGQGSLLKISGETGGRAFFQGTFTPISFKPFFRDLGLALNRQFALTYLSTHMKKGYHKVDVISTNPAIKIDHPKGYYYRKQRY
jgi:VWFA-related protein